MKNKSLLAVPFIVFAFACGNGGGTNASESTKTAMDSSQVKTDSSTMASTLTSTYSIFAVTIAEAGMLEIQLGTLAQSKAQNQKVKDFGTMMVTDHTKAGDQLKSTAQSKHLMLPTQLSKESQDKVDDLAKKAGKGFDKAYIDAMVKGHTKVVDLYEGEIKNGSDANIKNFSTNTVATIRSHLSEAKKCNAVVK
jgi:putative membrane protein